MWTLIIATVVAIALWLVGGKKLEHSAAIEIDGSPDVIFTYLTEPEKHKSWVTGLAHVEPLESNMDENGASKRIRTTRVIATDGRESRFEDEVIRFQPNERLSVRSTNLDQIVTTIYQLEPKGTKTQFTYRVIKYYRGVKRILAPLNTDTTQSQIDQDVRKLKQLVEPGN